MSIPEIDMRLAFVRGKDGVVLCVKTNEHIASFVKALGNGTEELVEQYGAKWLNIAGEEPLKVWHAEAAQLQDLTVQNPRFRLDMPGKSLVIQPDYAGYQETLNLSFLRLVGAEQGIKIILKGNPMSTDYLSDLRSRLVNTCRTIYGDYIRPCELEGLIMRTTLNDNLL